MFGKMKLSFKSEETNKFSRILKQFESDVNLTELSNFQIPNLQISEISAQALIRSEISKSPSLQIPNLMSISLYTCDLMRNLQIFKSLKLQRKHLSVAKSPDPKSHEHFIV